MEQATARPFLKWAGGKRSLIPEILKEFPFDFRSYFEPFVGGGALFFAVAHKIEKAFLSDMNSELVQTYNVVRDQTNEVIECLRGHQGSHSAAHYTSVRNQHELSDPVEIAARFIYLYRTCFNGLYRVNSMGRFNVPMGSYKNSLICNEQKLRADAETLQKANIPTMDFSQIIPRLGDLVYCDPPYDGTCTSFMGDGFDFKKQER